MSQFYIDQMGGSPDVPTSFVTDDGTAIPAAHVLNVLGGDGIETYADPNLGNNLYIKIQNSTVNTGTTVNAQTIDIITVDCSVVGTYFFTAEVSGYEATGPNAAGAQIYTTIISDGANATVVDDTDSVSHKSAPIVAVDWNIVGSGTDAILQITGAAGFTINWGAILVYVFRGA